MDLAAELRDVVGALAVAVWGAPRATKDIDLLIEATNLLRAKLALRPLGYTLEAGLMDFSDGMTIARVSKVQEGGLMTVDFLLVNQNLQAVFDGRSSRMMGHMPLVVVSREGLIQMKLQAGRPQDQMDVIKLTEMDR